MSLTPKQRSFLRGKAHHLQPTVTVGKDGVSEGVLQALFHALRCHELVKIKVPSADQDDFRQTVDEILGECDAEKVQTIGHLLVLFRPSTPAGLITKALKDEGIPLACKATLSE